MAPSCVITDMCSLHPKDNVCPCCERRVALTFHHFIPKKVHRRTFFRKHFSKAELAAGIMVCRRCHDGIHALYDEMTLARQFNSTQQLLEDEALRKHFQWVAKQRGGR